MWSKKIIENQSFFDDFFFDQFFSINFFFDQKFSIQKIFFDQKHFSTKMFWDFFPTKNYPIKKNWLPIPIRKFPKIPKIALRTACGHFKKQLEQKVTVKVLLDRHGTTYQKIESVLPPATGAVPTTQSIILNILRYCQMKRRETRQFSEFPKFCAIIR